MEKMNKHDQVQDASLKQRLIPSPGQRLTSTLLELVTDKTVAQMEAMT
jgi:hypothetical protein